DTPDCPVATNTQASLVDVSPSMVMALKLLSVVSRSNCCNNDASTMASVATNPNMVAILGLIMPAPLEIPVIVTVFPSTTICRHAPFGRVSVVMMPSAASDQASASSACKAAGKPASIRSTGNGSPITPVENGNTCCAVTLANAATASQLRRALAKPDVPVP